MTKAGSGLAELMDVAGLQTELERIHAETYGWALSCCSRDPAEAEATLQTAYLKVLQGKARFGGRSSFKTWFFAVVRRTAADRRRRRLLRAVRLVSIDAASGATSPARTVESVYRSEVRDLLVAALAALPRRQREVLQLVFYHELTVAESAEVIGVSVGSARTHYERGKSRLREILIATRAFNESGCGRQENQGAVPGVEAG